MALDEGKNPRRLLSFDILSRSSSPLDASKSRSQPSKPQFTSNLQQRIVSDDEEITIETTRSQESWAGINLSEPHSTSGANSLKGLSPIPEGKRKLVPLRSTTPDATVTASSSRNRWEQLRQHVLPVPSHSNTPPIPGLPPGVSQTPLLSVKSQPSLQKPSRLGLLGFRHVVEHAREADEARKVSQEFEKVCWSIRMPDPGKLKADSNLTASSLHLAFASNTSLASDGTSTLERYPHVDTKHGLRRSQSVQSLKTYHAVHSVKPIYHLLLQQSNFLMERRTTFVTLPHESLVLSTLLDPFLSPEENQWLEEERWNAIEAFEIITRFWAPNNEEKGIERYLWCCKAATIPPGAMRTRILNILRGLITSTENNHVISTPQCFQTLAQGLFSLLPHLRPSFSSPVAHEEIPLLMDLISQEEYGAAFSDKDDKNLIREVILLEGLSRCLEDCPNDSRVWLLQNVVEHYWIKVPEETKLTPLLSAIYIRTLKALSRALLNILLVPLDQGASSQRAHCLAQLIQSRLIPDMDALNAVKPEAKINVIKTVLQISCIDSSRGPVQWGLSLLHTWYCGTSVWKSHLELTLQEIISKGTWSNVILQLTTLIRLLPDEDRKPMVTLLLPLLYDRLVDGPPPFPCIALTNLLDTIARLYPQIFYKPLFLCAASSKEFSIINHLCVIGIVSKFFPDFWIRDAEMVSVALMSDFGKKGLETEPRTRTKTRLGQAVVMLEFIAFIQSTRHEKELSHCSDSLRAETCKFIAALEARLAILLEARERTTSLTTSQRLLLCVMLREMRLLTRSLSSISWLVQAVGWCIDIYRDDYLDPEEEEESTIDQIQGLYLAAQDSVRSMTQRRSTKVLSKSLSKSLSADDQPTKTLAVLVAMFVQRQSLLTSVSKGFVRKAMKLLVTMSTLLTPTEYRRLCPYLWDLLRNDGDASLTAAVCFLIMQCKKLSLLRSELLTISFSSSNDDTKLNAIYRIGILFNWRYQIISQQFVADRARRPFKVVRGPLAFVSTDIGSTAYIREDDPNEMKDNLPAELRKRLVEIGWNHDDAPIDQHQEWIKVPISLLSSQQLDRLENIGPDVAPPPSPTMLNLGTLPSFTGDKSEDIGLLRRNSSTGGPVHTLKRRAVFVPSLALMFPRLASLVFDSNLAISSAARSTMLDIMRNDPTLIGRPVLDLFAGEQKDIQSAVAILDTFFHVQKVLPYPISHYLFNNLAGFLKWASRQPEETNSLQDFAHTVPILARLVTQVSGLSIRDIRRAKIEPFLVPSGSLWFSSAAPSGPMFPRNIEPCSDLFGSLPSDVVAITTIRVSQNMLLLAMLQRNHHDVQLVRKSMSRLELPTTTPINQSPLELVDFVPSRRKKEQINPSLTCLSLLLSRSHVMLIAQIFRSMSRHLNDLNELATLVDGLNRILLMHGDDIGIVSQVIIGEFIREKQIVLAPDPVS
ncbi:hypothetical protein C0993_005089 [Termitomyces sp. T159_Od127]|nr:hypothetical protein C0993_005089 [Termitomyces sp. T159_Od127]